MTKALSARQVYWAKILSQYNFLIKYKPGAMNHADALTWQEQDLENQVATKIVLHTQILLGPEQLDPRIIAELPMDQSLEICPIETSGLDLIDELLQTNHILPMLQEYHDKVKDHARPWTLEDNGLLKH